jgi:pyruvate dehydrogenase complex dehydrogenase (E1) component
LDAFVSEALTDTEVLPEALEAIHRRVLWLTTPTVHHANKVRETTSRVSVGGYQVSSASMVSVMTRPILVPRRAGSVAFDLVV